MDAPYLRQLQLGPMENFVYLLGAGDSREAVVIDPAWDVEAIRRAAAEAGRTLTAALCTHHHFDHVNGLPDLVSETSVQVYVHALDAPRLPELPRGRVTPVQDGAVIGAAGLRLTALHAPGHTPGCCCWLAGGSIFAGDVLFVGGCGRCDLEGGDPRAMRRSLMRIASLPDETVLWPGHDYGEVPARPLGEEKRRNPYLQRLGDEAAFVAHRMRPR